MNIDRQIEQAVNILQNGGIIAYPTEAVFGLGCDPFNETAVMRILNLKKRAVNKGLILIASDFGQIGHLIIPLEKNIINRALSTWPGPVTWIIPASKLAPKWITGDHDSIALRVTAHPIAKQICQKFGGAIVSTSANIEGEPPATTAAEASTVFPSQIDYIVEANVGKLSKPTPIYDILTEQALR